MRKILLALAAIVVLGAAVFIATADTKETKAKKAYASAQEFVAKGDEPRAMISLRNALQNDPEMRDARLMFADLLLKSGRRADAFGQYRQLLLKDGNDLAAARAMAQIAFEAMSWDEARTYSQQVLAQKPDDVTMQAIMAGIAYREAVVAKDTDAIARAATEERRLLAENPGLMTARRVVIADALREGDLEGALKTTDEGLAQKPDDRDLNNTRLVLLERMGRDADLEAHLLAMLGMFPKDEELGQVLVRFYVSRGRIDDAEKTLRSHVDPNSDKADPRLVLLRFLAEVRSTEAMRDELAQVLAQTPLPKDVAANPVPFYILKAQADYMLGDRDKAMADLEGHIKGAEPSVDVDRMKIQLAKLRVGTGNIVGARALVEEVLAHDQNQTEAMKMKAEWLTQEDKTDEAVALLRDALADAPNDAQILTLLAQAYQREGRPELMSDMLARAVEVSNQAPMESLRYANWLFQQGDYLPAETVLIDALRRQSNNPELLVLLARTHLAMKDWGRSQQDIDAIAQRFDTPEAKGAVQELRAQLLAGQGRNEDLTQFLDQQSINSNDPVGLRMAMVRNLATTGKVDQARGEAERLAAENPDLPGVQLLVVQLMLAQGESDAALEKARTILAAQPTYLPAWLVIQAAQLRANQPDAALATIEQGLAALPDNRALLLAKAVVEEKRGDIDAAIQIYEGLYTAKSDDPVVANNLASLLASTRDDQASLDRAWTVARRLNGIDVAAFQDTYGWIAFRRGENAVAVNSLEKAAKGLPDDPAVAYHLGRAYDVAGRKDEAAAEYDRADALLSKGMIGYPKLADDLVKARGALKGAK